MTEKPLKTKHLILTPMTDEALSRLAETAAEEREAYGQMLALCRAHPEDRLWYAPWQISLKSQPDVPIGSLGFRSPQQKGRVELGCGVDLPYRCRGYATEAAGALIEWAFAQKDVYIVQAEAAADNAASLRVLEKLNFTPDRQGAEGPRFHLDRTPTSWLSIGMCLGMCFGVSFSTLFHSNIALGIGPGMCLGMALGAAADARERKHRAEVTGIPVGEEE